MLPITLQLDWKPNAQFAGLLWAYAHGWYAQAGIDLTIRSWRPHYNQMDALDEPGNVVVSTEDNLLIQACDLGKPVKAIGTMNQFSGIGWMALRESGIGGIQDLRGKRIGVHPDGITAIVVALKQFGLTRADVELVDVSYDYGALLRGGEFDAIQCYVIVEPYELARQGFDLTTLVAHEWGYRVYSQVFATTDRLIATHRQRLVDFLRVSFDGWRQAIDHPLEAAQIVQTFLPDCDVATEQATLVAMRPFLVGEVGAVRLGVMSADRWQGSIDLLSGQGVLSRAVTPADVMTLELMEAVYGQPHAGLAN